MLITSFLDVMSHCPQICCRLQIAIAGHPDLDAAWFLGELRCACEYTRKQAIAFVYCRKDMLEFMHKAAKVTDDIMTCFAIGLGLPEDFYKQARALWRSVSMSVCTHCLLAHLDDIGSLQSAIDIAIKICRTSCNLHSAITQVARPPQCYACQ